VAGIILAAGESQRFGQPKPLLLWRGEPFIRHSARTALEAGLSPVIVVTGEHASELQAACAGLGVELVHNPDWESGQSASVKAGLRQLPSEAGAVVFLLADQPQAPSGLVRLLVETHAAGLPPIVAPLVDGRRANPVLFDRLTFPDLMALHGDVGGRALFSKYPIAWVPWHDPSVLLDIDTPQDYQRLLELK
jgi:molybdenum cofactor cytidylyltransferase